MGWSCPGVAGPASLCPRSGEERGRCSTCEPVVHTNPAAFPFSSNLWGNGRASLSWQDLILSQGSVLEAGRSCRAVLSEHGAGLWGGRPEGSCVMESPRDRGRWDGFLLPGQRVAAQLLYNVLPSPGSSRQGAGFL